jgi:hypothetical protein
MNSPRFSRPDRSPRRAVASFDRYPEAERAVDFLADRRFPVEHVSIVGRDLEYVEEVTGRMTYGRAALNGALTGAMIGVLVGWLFGLFDWFDPLVSAFWLALDGLWFGALVGALMGLFLHLLSGGRRDFAAVAGMRAKRYEVLVDEPFADEAERRLSEIQPRGTRRDEAADGAAATPLER